jgi:putative oligomerization/nucleic acid binding protein
VTENEQPIDAAATPASTDDTTTESTDATTAASKDDTTAASKDDTTAASKDDTTPASTDGDQGPAPAKTGISRRRLVLVDAVIAIATILAIVGMVAVWANRLLFSPDNWENTSTQLLQNPDIRSATANYIVDQIYANVDVAGLIRSALPPRLDPLADPAAGALRNAAVQGVDLALSRPRVQSLWAAANRAADQTFIAVVKGGKGSIGVKQGVVTLDLGSLIDNVASRLGLPSNISSKLPPSIGTLTIIRSNQLKFVQDVGNAIQGLALWLTILAPVLYAVAILLARNHRRRTLMSVGFAIVFAGVLGLAARSLLESQITNSITNDEALRPAVRATVAIGTAILGSIAGAFILFGIVVAVAAWFAGPARLATAARRALAPFLRDQPIWTYAIVLGVMVVIFIWQPIHATGTPAGIIVFLALALLGTEALRRESAIEFPNAQSGDTTAAMRARWDASRAGRQAEHAPAAGQPASLTEQLERLADLRNKGAISSEEYEAAKANVLQHV